MILSRELRQPASRFGILHQAPPDIILTAACIAAAAACNAREAEVYVLPLTATRQSILIAVARAK